MVILLIFYIIGKQCEKAAIEDPEATPGLFCTIGNAVAAFFDFIGEAISWLAENIWFAIIAISTWLATGVASVVYKVFGGGTGNGGAGNDPNKPTNPGSGENPDRPEPPADHPPVGGEPAPDHPPPGGRPH